MISIKTANRYERMQKQKEKESFRGKWKSQKKKERINEQNWRSHFKNLYPHFSTGKQYEKNKREEKSWNERERKRRRSNEEVRERKGVADRKWKW